MRKVLALFFSNSFETFLYLVNTQRVKFEVGAETRVAPRLKARL